jgi:DNA-binding beta-propeller fold protein YncE
VKSHAKQAKAPSAGSMTRRARSLGAAALVPLVLALTLACALCAVPALAAAPSHPEIPSLNHTSGLNDPCGNAVDTAGNLYVSSYATKTIRIYDTSGVELTSFSTSGIGGEGPCGIAVDSGGNVYVTRWGVDVYKFKPSAFPPTGATTYAPDTAGTTSGTGRIAAGTSAAVDPATQNLYIAQGGHISSYQPDGTLINGTIGEGLIAGANYYGVDVYGAGGEVYATDKAHSKVVVFNAAGTAVKAEFNGSDSEAGAFNFAGAFPYLAVDQANAHVYVADVKAHQVVDEFDAAGHFVSAIVHSPALAEAEPSDIAVDNGAASPNQGNVYVTSGATAGTSRVWAFGPLPVPSHPEIPSLNHTSGLNDPCGNAVDTAGNLYVSSYATKTIRIYDTSGVELTSFSTSGIGGEGPCGIAVDSGGNVYVTRWGVDVYKFKPSAFPPTGATTYAPDTAGTTSGTGRIAAGTSAAVDPATQNLYIAQGGHISSYQPDGTLINGTIGEGLIAGANYYGVDVYGAGGEVYATDKAHSKVVVFNAAGTAVKAEFNGSDSEAGAFNFAGAFPYLAVDQANAHVYVADVKAHQVVDEFDAAGHFVSAIVHSPALAEAEPSDIAVDNGAASPNKGNVYVTSGATAGTSRVWAFGPLVYGHPLTVTKAGSGQGTVSGGSVAKPNAIDCGATCEATLEDAAEVILTPSPAAGSSFTAWSGCTSVVGAECHVTMDAAKAVTATFTTSHLAVQKSGPGTGTVTAAPNTAPQASAAIECGATCAADFLPDTEVTLTAAPDPGSALDAWDGCDSVNGNQCTVTMDAAKTITATFAAKPTVSTDPPTEVSSFSATLNGTVNPNGKQTSWHFEYTEEADFLINGFASATKVPVPEFSAGAGAGDVAVSRSIAGLQPATAYRFRLVATNVIDTAGSAPRAFATYEASLPPEPCDNDALRSGQSAKLPDCRAYEQATPVDKNGQDARGLIDAMAASTDGDSILYYSANGQPGGVGPQKYPLYLARRDAGRWSTQGVLPPLSYGDSTSLKGWLPDLSSVFIGTFFNKNIADRTLLAHNADRSLTTISDLGYAKVVGASADDSIVYFSSTSDETAFPLTGDAEPGKPNLYAWDRDTGTLALAGVLPDGDCAGPDPCVPAQGSGVRVGNPGDGPFAQSAENSYPVEAHAVTASGDAFFNDVGTGQLYLRKDPLGSPETIHVSASQRTDCADDPGGCSGDPAPDIPLPATFQGATPDGSVAFFTSQEELTGASNTTPPLDPPGISRADLPDPLATPPCDTDPCNVNNHLVPLVGNPPAALALAADADHLYWIEQGSNSISRSDLNGGSVEHDFITGADNPRDVTVHLDSDAAGPDRDYLFWTNKGDGTAGTGSIGRAELNGDDPASNIDQGCLTDITNPLGIDTNATNVYWTMPGTSSLEIFLGSGDVGRANLDCGNVNLQLIDGNASGDIAVDASHIYISFALPTLEVGGINRPDIDGTFGAGSIVELHGVSGPVGVALDSTHLYWTNPTPSAIGRSDLAGSDASENHAFVPNLTAPIAVAVGEGADGGHLYWSTGQSGGGTRGKDLYRWDAASGDLTDLSYDPDDDFGADVRGFLGASDDGSYAYFVANADLDGDAEAEPGNCTGSSVTGGDLSNFSGQCSIYLAHGGETTFVARLDTAETTSDHGRRSDTANWLGLDDASPTQKTSRVSAEGVLLFRSQRQLTAYDNQGSLCVKNKSNEFVPGPCPEFYRYDPAADQLSCLTCNPTGAPPIRPPQLAQVNFGAPNPGRFPGLTSNLSVDSDRFFFESSDKLVSADVNGEGGCPGVQVGANGSVLTPACLDLYMWEAEGTGSCHSSAQNGGCLHLISPGTGSQPSFFLGASESGDDAFFFTRDRLVPQDADSLIDVYDASVGGGLAYQHASSPPACQGDACRGQASSAPSSQGAASATFSGPGNPPSSKARCPKGKRKVRRGGVVRCVKPRKHKRHRRTANHDRRASR